MEYQLFENQFDLTKNIFRNRNQYNNYYLIRPMYELSNRFLINLNERKCNKLLLGSGDETEGNESRPFSETILNYNKFICFETGIQNYHEIENNVHSFLIREPYNNNHHIGYFDLNNNIMLDILNHYGKNKFNLIEIQYASHYFFKNPKIIFTMINLLKNNGTFRFPLIYPSNNIINNPNRTNYINTSFDNYIHNNRPDYYYNFLVSDHRLFNLPRFTKDELIRVYNKFTNIQTLNHQTIYQEIKNLINIHNDIYLYSEEKNTNIKLTIHLKNFFENLFLNINRINRFESIDQFYKIISIHSLVKSFLNNQYIIINEPRINDRTKLYNLSISTTPLINQLDFNFVIKRVNIFNHLNNNVHRNCNVLNLNESNVITYTGIGTETGTETGTGTGTETETGTGTGTETNLSGGKKKVTKKKVTKKKVTKKKVLKKNVTKK